MYLFFPSGTGCVGECTRTGKPQEEITKKGKENRGEGEGRRGNGSSVRESSSQRLRSYANYIFTSPSGPYKPVWPKYRYMRSCAGIFQPAARPALYTSTQRERESLPVNALAFPLCRFQKVTVTSGVLSQARRWARGRQSVCRLLDLLSTKGEPAKVGVHLTLLVRN